MRAAVLAILCALGPGQVHAGDGVPPWWDTFVAISGPRAPMRAAQVWAESSWKLDATSYRVGPDGKRVPLAKGPAQFIDATWSRYADPGTSPYDLVPALRAQHRMMTDLERLWGGDDERALASYNCGPGNVRRAVRLAESLGDDTRGGWKRTLVCVTGKHSAETLGYVPKILRKEVSIRRAVGW